MTERTRVDLASSPVRCPYCHDDVAVSSDGWIACAACLARHHLACWHEGGKCATCGGTRTLLPSAASAPPELVFSRARAAGGLDQRPEARTDRPHAPGTLQHGESGPGVAIFALVSATWFASLFGSQGVIRALDAGTGSWVVRNPVRGVLLESLPCVLPLLVLGVAIAAVVRARRRRGREEPPGAAKEE